jgi:hypothetical protein
MRLVLARSPLPRRIGRFSRAPASAVPLVLTASEHHRLKKMDGHKPPHQAWQRATIVLLAARGHPNA